MPMGNALSGIAAENIGECAYGIFRQGKQWIGKRVGIAGDHVSGAQMAADMSKALGKEVAYNVVSPKCFVDLLPGADDLRQHVPVLHGVRRGSAEVGRVLETSRSLNPELLNFKTWLAKYEDHVPGGLAIKAKTRLLIFSVTIALGVFAGTALYAQDAKQKYSLTSPGGIAFADFKGYEDWSVVSSARTDEVLKVIVANPMMIKAYGASG